MTKKHGKCALCGSVCKLGFEHIPPKSAFNAETVRKYSGLEILFDKKRDPRDVQGLKYVLQQQGAGAHTLCGKCNNNTGKWYGNTYKEVARIIAEAFSQSKKETIPGIRIEEIYGARFIKQVLSMFCSINNHEFLQGYLDPDIEGLSGNLSPIARTIFKTKIDLMNAAIHVEDLRTFVLDKDAKGLDKSKFKLCMYFTDSQTSKRVGVVSLGNWKEDKHFIISEVAMWPLGFVLYFYPPENSDFVGVDITALADLGYNDLVSIEFPFVIKEINTCIPLDYRSKEQIEEATSK